MMQVMLFNYLQIYIKTDKLLNCCDVVK